MMTNQIKHEGIIQRIDGEHVQVRIVQTSACLHCKIASHCNSAESKEKVIDVWTKKAASYTPGQKVCVVMGGKLGLKAVFWAFVMPTILSAAVIAIILQITAPDGYHPVAEPYNQGYAAVGGMIAFVVYYTILYFFRGVAQQTFRFSIE